MINTTGSVASLLSQTYQSNTDQMNQSMARLSSGKRVANAGDDFSAYFKAQTNSGYINQYTSYSQELQHAKGFADLGVATGNTVLAELGKLSDLADQYSATSDVNTQAALNAQFKAIVTTLSSTIAGSYFDNKQVYQAAAINTVNSTIDGINMNMNVTATAVAAVATLKDASVTSAVVQAEIQKGETYVAQMQAAQDALSSQINLNNTIISSYKATNSILVDVNEAEEQLKVTNLQVRQQATASMMAQANSSAAAIAKLFQ